MDEPESRGLLQIAAREDGWNRLPLNRRGCYVAFVGDGAQQRLGQPEGGK